MDFNRKSQNWAYYQIVSKQILKINLEFDEN